MKTELAGYPNEHQYMLEILKAFILKKPSAPLPPEHLDCGRLAALSQHHNIGPICCFMLENSGRLSDLVQQWHQQRLAVLLRNIKITKSAVWLFALLQGNGIPAVSFRGLNVASVFYPQAGLRSMRDVDILIRASDRKRCEAVLAAEGHRPQRVLRSQLLYSINNIPFEIHWSYLTPKRYRRSFATQQMLADRIRLTTAEGDLFCLKLEHEMIGLVAHAFIHHHLESLRQLVDIALLLVHEDIDWNAIADGCRANRFTRLFYFTFSFVDRFFELNRQQCYSALACKLPAKVDRMFAAYAAALWGSDCLRHRFARQASLMFVAERPITKLRQLVRFAAVDQIKPLLGLVFQNRLSRVGGMESDTGRYGTAESRKISEI